MRGLVYPELCARCDRRVPAPAALPVCPTCLTQMPRPAEDEVPARLAELPGGHEIANGAVALWRFDDGGAVQRVQHALKYGHRPGLGPPLGRLLARAVPEGPDAVVAVPLARTRELERGYNQSAALAAGVAERLGVPALRGALVRDRATRSQTDLARAERWRNVEGAFRVAEPGAVAGRRVVLVDDVMTTGATLLAAAAPLQAAGATVTVAVLALAT